jgi:hypothetical protein
VEEEFKRESLFYMGPGLEFIQDNAPIHSAYSNNGLRIMVLPVD